jgi:hypothetical protein
MPERILNDSLELSPPTTVKKESNKRMPFKTELPPAESYKIAPKIQRSGYEDDEEADHFNELLNSSPKKSQKNTHTKNREWEELEALTDKKR